MILPTIKTETTTRSMISTSTTTTARPTTRTTTTHKRRDKDQTTETDRRATRSKASHHGIVINRGGAASGRPAPTLRAVNHVVDRPVAVSDLGRSSWF